MKAVLLAAGKGSRLGDLGTTLPKPLIEIDGKPLLAHNIELCRKYGVSEVFINTHHLADKIRLCCGDGSTFGVRITYSFEPELLGTAGALLNFREQLSAQPFFVLYADNYSNYNLDLLVNKYQTTETMGVIGFHYREDVKSSGVAEFDDSFRVLKFIEKPRRNQAQGNWVNAGIYFLNPRIFEFIPEGFSDFGGDIFPKLLSDNIPLHGVCERATVKAFDTPEMYRNSLET